MPGRRSALLAAAALSPRAPPLPRPSSSRARPRALKPGQWVWAPQIAPAGPVLVYVDLSTQTADVYRNGVRIAATTVSTGKPGHETPTGVFHILQKDPNHHSSKYNNAPMPFQERLTLDGIALHAGGLPGYPESHGCVHLPLEFSKLLFGITHLGGTVIIAGAPGKPMMSPDLGVLEPDRHRLHPAARAGQPVHLATAIVTHRPGHRRHFQKRPAGDRAAQRGRDRARAGAHPRRRLRNPCDDLCGHQNGRPQWIYAGVPGHAGEAGKPADMTMLSGADMPPAFAAALRSVSRRGDDPAHRGAGRPTPPASR